MLTRRRFLQASVAALFTGASLGAYAFEIEPYWVEFVRRSLPIRDLPSSLIGRSLVQLSDIHVGSVDDDYVISVFRHVAELRPDIVVATGDLMTYCQGAFEHVASVYRHFPLGRIATLATLGNHDYGPRWAHSEIAARVIDIVSEFGVTVMRNEIHEVEGLQIVGLDDLLAKRFDHEHVSPLVKSAKPAIVLSHNPDTADLPVWDGYDGWILSGHTHGGQCKPPFLPPPLLPCCNPRYTCGEFALSGSRRMYMNRGVGNILNVRFNVRPEVTIFELRRA
jgi:predicted MPP superfamily phosphohydrolase